MNLLHPPRCARHEKRQVFDARTQVVRDEGEHLKCPFCGDILAWTERSLLTGDLDVSTRYVLNREGIWVYPTKGASIGANARLRRAMRREQMQRDLESGLTAQEARAEVKAIKRFQEKEKNRMVTNARTGERSRMATKAGQIQAVEETGIFRCFKCEGLVKIERSNN